MSMDGAYWCWGAETRMWEACPDDLLNKQVSLPQPSHPPCHARSSTATACCAVRSSCVQHGPEDLPTDCAVSLLPDRPAHPLTKHPRAPSCSLHSSVQPEAGELGVDAASVALPVVPIRSRETRSRGTCILPTVYQASHWRAGCSGGVVVMAAA